MYQEKFSFSVTFIIYYSLLKARLAYSLFEGWVCNSSFIGKDHIDANLHVYLYTFYF
jgi:hypothetical protein